MRVRRVTTLAAGCAAAAACALAGCSSSGSGGGSSSATTSSRASLPASTSSSAASTKAPATPSTTPSSTPAPSSSDASKAAQVLSGLSLRDRVGQLLMVDCPSAGVSDATRSAITQSHVGSVILDGTSEAGLQATRAVTARLRDLAPAGVGLFVATDQEGGQVQRVQGPGFAAIPSAVRQGQDPASVLQDDAKTWGGQLRKAGVNVNLAPSLDTVPSGASNPPIGDLDREYGSTPGTVTTHGLAFARGMTAAGIDVTAKHFPGLGRVTRNTDTTNGVTDSTTTRDDAYLAPFRAAVTDHVPFVMMSTAIYSRIDPGTPAAFSRTIVSGMLRGDLGFRGVVITDDVGAAKQVSDVSPGQRAVRFVQAGGDMVLTVVADQAADMTDALLARARSDASFKKLVDAAALRVLEAKQARGLLG